MTEEVQALEGEGEWIKSDFSLELTEGISDTSLGLDAKGPGKSFNSQHRNALL